MSEVTLKEMVERFEAESIAKDNKVSFFEMLTPAFVGGIMMGLLAGTPGLSLLFFFFPLGGYIAAKMVTQVYEKRIDMKDSAKVGAFAGLLGGFFSSLILLIFSIFFAERVFVFFMGILGIENTAFIMTLSGIDPTISFYNLRIRFLVNMVLCTVCGSIGGVIFSMRNK